MSEEIVISPKTDEDGAVSTMSGHGSGASFLSFRRRSVLGPPSLFPNQRRNSDFFNGGPVHVYQVDEAPIRSRGRPSQEDVEITIADLDFYYGLMKRQILRYQSPTTGLFPDHSKEKKVGSVRSTIYCSMAVWSLQQAYKRIDDDRGKTYELGQSAVLGVRGILISWMRQSKRLEAFKAKQTPGHALHSKFDLDTGFEILSVEDYNHLQIDVVSLYLLFLVQTITSGLQVIFDMNEVNFVQNLVYYVERAYRTPDYGMWERGTKQNDGTCEVHASSIGMAKAALEAINGINLFGDRGASWSVVYVDIDAHNRNRSIFETLLPRESASKEVDAALLPTITFPAFATHDHRLYEQTKTKVMCGLEGSHGFKRFERDGFGSAIEPKGRKYPDGLIQQFDGGESEWPMFYAYMVIDGVFKGKPSQVEKYQELMKKRLAYNGIGDPVLPQYYYVEELSIGEPVKHYIASNDGCSSSDLFLWGQSLLIISDLLTSQLLNVHELDPIGRHLPSYSRPKVDTRYSAFEAASVDLVVQVVTIAESIRLQSVLATYGIQTQTPNEIEPVQIWPQSEMVKVFEKLGRNEMLGLSGRPARPIGSLGSSKFYRMCGQTVLCYPLIFSASDFYLSHDMAHLTDEIKSELKFVSRCWRLSGRPTVCIIVTETKMRDPQFHVLLKFLAELRTGSIDGVKVRLGRLQNLKSSACLEHLDFLRHIGEEEVGLEGKRFKQLENEHIGYQTLTDIPVHKAIVEERQDFMTEFKNKSSNEISTAIVSCNHLYGSIQMLGILMDREGGDYLVGDLSVTSRLEALNRNAGASRQWAAVRYSSALLGQIVDSISPLVTQILVSGKQVTVGTIGMEFSLFDKPMTPDEIRHAIYTKVRPFNVISAVLQQELILYCGKLIATNPELFEGILKIRIGWILHGLDLYRNMKEHDPQPIENFSPSEIRRLLKKVLTESKVLQLTYGHINKEALHKLDSGRTAKMTIYEVRQINGCLNRVPVNFYLDMWLILSRSRCGIHIGIHYLPREPYLTQLTSTDDAFAHEVETMFNDFEECEYKQLVVELFCVMAAILKRNPELEFTENVDSTAIIDDAIRMFKVDEGIEDNEKFEFYQKSVAQTSGYLARAIINNLLKGSILSKVDESRTEYNCPVQ